MKPDFPCKKDPKRTGVGWHFLMGFFFKLTLEKQHAESGKKKSGNNFMVFHAGRDKNKTQCLPLGATGDTSALPWTTPGSKFRAAFFGGKKENCMVTPQKIQSLAAALTQSNA